jgi:hypothetical protein
MLIELSSAIALTLKSCILQMVLGEQVTIKNAKVLLHSNDSMPYSVLISHMLKVRGFVKTKGTV